jgi:hypothetical protein
MGFPAAAQEFLATFCRGVLSPDGRQNPTGTNTTERPQDASPGHAWGQRARDRVESFVIHFATPPMSHDRRKPDRPNPAGPGSAFAPPATMATSSAAGIIVSELAAS